MWTQSIVPHRTITLPANLPMCHERHSLLAVPSKSAHTECQCSSLFALSPSHQGHAALMFHRQLSLSSQPHQAHLCSDLLPQAPGSSPREPTAAPAWLSLNPGSALHAFGTGKQQSPSLPWAGGSDHQPHPACSLNSILWLEGENAQHLPCIPSLPQLATIA